MEPVYALTENAVQLESFLFYVSDYIGATGINPQPVVNSALTSGKK